MTMNIFTASYTPDDESEQPHRLHINLAGFNTTLSFPTLQDLQTFVLGAQNALGTALGQAISHIPAPKEIDTVDEDYLETVIGYLDDVRSEIDCIDVDIDMDNLASQVHSFIEGLGSGDLELEIKSDSIKTELEATEALLRGKLEELQKARREAEADQKLRDEQRELAESAGAGGHEPGGHSIQ